MAKAVLMPLLYYVISAPFGIVMRLIGWDPLRLRRDPIAPSYWVARRPPGPAPATMQRQF
jgi:hypothetical protein